MNEREHRLGLHSLPHPMTPARRILPQFAGNAGRFSPLRSHSPSPGCCHADTRSRRRQGAPPGQGLGSSPLGPGRPTGAAALSGTLPSGQLRQGSRCGDLARDTPPLPRNSSTRQGQGRPILAAGPGGPWTHRPGPRRSEETAQAARLAEGRGRNDKPLV